MKPFLQIICVLLCLLFTGCDAMYYDSTPDKGELCTPQALLDSYVKKTEQTDAEQVPEVLQTVAWNAVPVSGSEQAVQDALMEAFAGHSSRLSCLTTEKMEFEKLAKEMEHFGVLNMDCTWMRLESGDVLYYYVVYDCLYTTGVQIFEAIRQKTVQELDGRMLRTYLAAREFIDQKLDRKATPLMQEKQIVDYICGVTEYYDGQEGLGTFRQADGVLLDGAANCMGYADAFWLLATMAGFTVTCDSDTEHMWNLLTMDGKTYIVDVTWCDRSGESPSYVYFNAPLEIVREKYGIRPDSPTAGAVAACDEMYLYAAPGFGADVHDREECYLVLTEQLTVEAKPAWMLCRGFAPEADRETFIQELADRIGMGGSLLTEYQQIGQNTLIYAEFQAD